VSATDVTRNLGLDPADVDREQPHLRTGRIKRGVRYVLVRHPGRWSNTKATQRIGLDKFEEADWAGNGQSRNCRVSGTMEPSWRDRYAVKQANRSKECGYRKVGEPTTSEEMCELWS
jgi:hypothetical protein